MRGPGGDGSGELRARERDRLLGGPSLEQARLRELVADPAYVVARGLGRSSTG
jgi:hypothetical protein